MTIIRILVAGLCAAALHLPAAAQRDQAPVDPSEAAETKDAPKAGFAVAVSDGAAAKAKRIGSGVVVSANNDVLASAAAIDGRKEVYVRFPGDPKSYLANVEAADNDLGIALLRVEGGPKSEPVTAALDDPAPGAAIGAAFVAEDGARANASGAFGKAAQTASGRYLVHNAMIPAAGYGSAVTNECGQLVGINVVSPFLSRSQARRLETPKESVYGLGRQPVLDFLKKWSVSPVVAVAACKPAAVVAKEEAAEAKKAADTAKVAVEDVQKQLLEAEEKAKAAQQAADDARALAAQRKQESDRIRTDAKATEAERKEAEEAAAEAQKAAEVAAVDAAAYADTITAMKKQVDTLQTTLKAEEQNRLYMIIGGGVGGLLIIMTAWLLLSRRGAQLKKVKAGLAKAEATIGQTFPDVECRGKDASDNPHAFKVTGAALLKAENGLVIGRQPQSADIVLNHPEISRAHVRVMRRGDAVLIEDLGTTNGTRLNGKSLTSKEPAQIRTGDELMLGTIRFTVRFLDV